MTHWFTRIVFLAVFSGAAFGQSPDAVKFEIADVHVSPPSPYTYMQVNPLRAGRCEFHNASIIDLIGVAYDVKAEKIVGGPSWLEMDRFDVIAKVPPGTKAEAPGSAPDALPDAVKDMLQSLLADRFKLVLHKDTRSLTGHALTVGKKLQLQKADGSGDTGCRLQPSTDPGNTTIRYTCRNVSMEALASMWPKLRGTPDEPVVDKTELEGMWNFEMKWSSSSTITGAGDAIGPADAIEKQLGLKLEIQQNPAQVFVVDRVNEKPTANPPGVAEALPIAPVPTEFEAATIKPTDPDAKRYTGQTGLVGDRWIFRSIALRGLIIVAFSPSIAQMNDDLVVGIPGWAETEKFDLDGKKPPGAAANARLGPMLRSLLEDRFRMKSHTEERPVSVYVLEAGKSKMKESDPASRTHCLSSAAPAGSPPGSQVLKCQNITMSQFAEQIRMRAPGPGWPVFDSTGIEGGRDFTLIWVRTLAPAKSANETEQSGGAPVASDPSGGLTLIEALDKQLGLKLQVQKRPMPVTVIDHLEQKPTDN